MSREFDLEVGVQRVVALIERERVVHSLVCEECGDPEGTTFYLAVLGWTPQAFIDEAYDWDPEAGVFRA